MTPQQLTTLEAAILADPTVAEMFTDGNLQGLADHYNSAAAPAFIVWKSAVTQDEIMQNGFDWVRVDNLSVGKARIWEWLFANERRAINPSKANVRAGIDETWKGTAPDLAVRAAVYVHCKRPATRLEIVFATGAGTEADPGTMAVEGPVQYTDFQGI